MPFESKRVQQSFRVECEKAQAPCALLLTADCQAVSGLIDYAGDWRSPRAFQGDHIDPDGGDDHANLQASCRECNRRKSNSLDAPAEVVFATWRRLTSR